MSLLNQFSLRNPRALILVDQSLVSATGFLVNFLLAWKLQLEIYGQYALFFLGMMLIMSLQQALFIQPAQVLFPRFNKFRQQQFLGALLLIAIPSLLVASVIFELVFKIVYSINIQTGLISTVCLIWLIYDLLRKLLILVNPTVSLVLIDALNALVFTVSIFIFNPESINDAIKLLGISSLIGIIFFLLLKPSLPSKRIAQFYLIKTLPTAGWMLLTAAVQWSSSNYLMVAAGAWINASALGILRLSQYVFGLLNIFLQSYENFAVPQVVKFQGLSGEKIRFIGRLSLPFLLPVGVLLVIMTVFFPFIFSYISTQPILEPVHYWLAGLYILILIGYPIRVYIRASGFNSIYFTAHLASLIMMVLSASFLINSFQTSGVLMGMILNQLIMIIIWIGYILLKKQITWKLSTSHLAR